MSNLPCIVICKAEVVNDLNNIWEAMGRGPNNISRKMCAVDPNATHETPATHYMMQDMSAQDSDVIVWQAMCEGDLPIINGTWGEDGIIEAAAAQAAAGNNNMQIYSAAGLVGGQDATDWRDSIFAGRGLQFVPDEPI